MLIYLDAGHSGDIEPGACADGVRECDVNLVFAMELGKHLEDLGHNVAYYRQSSTAETELYDRVRHANRYGADLYVSVHCNAFTDPVANGAEAFVCNDGCLQAKAYAEEMLAAVCSVGGMRNRGVKTANFYVLRQTDMPAVLLELGFLTNSADRERLTSITWQHDVSKAVAAAICGVQ